MCLCIPQQLVQEDDVHAVFHHKLSIQVENGNVPLVPVVPNPVLWTSDVHLLEDELTRRQTPLAG